MRDIERNKTEIHYSLLSVSKESDEWGNTHEVKGYSEPVKLKISVSANKGEASAQAFGADLKYDREMVTHDMACPIDELTHVSGLTADQQASHTTTRLQP